MIRDLRPDVPPDRPEPRLTDAEARHVLALATERERALGTSVSAAQLRDAALEAGISAGAFDDAVAEVRAAPARRHRRRRGLLAAGIGVALLVGVGGAALRRGVVPAPSAPPATQAPPALAGDRGAPATGADAQAAPMASSCGTAGGVPGDRLRALASGLYPEVLAPGNRHRWLTVALLFDADCHVKAHVLTRRGENDGNEEVLRLAFRAAYRAGWQSSGGADVGPWTFEEGKPMIVWGMERAPR